MISEGNFPGELDEREKKYLNTSNDGFYFQITSEISDPIHIIAFDEIVQMIVKYLEVSIGECDQDIATLCTPLCCKLDADFYKKLSVLLDRRMELEKQLETYL